MGIGMKLRTLLIVAALLTLSMSSMAVQSASAEKSSVSWPMFMADPSHSSRSTVDTSENPGQAVSWVPYWATGNASMVISARGTYFASIGTILYRLSYEHTVINRYVGNATLVGTPAIGWNDSAYVGSLDMNVYALDGNGTKWWSFNTSAPVRSSPTIVDNSTLFVTSAGLMSFTLDGRLNWRVLQNVTSRSSPAVSSGGTIYFGAEDGALYAISSTGKQLWYFNTSAPVRTSPSIDSDGNVHFGSDDGLVYCVSPDGVVLWSYDTGAPVRSSVGLGSDGTSLFLTGNGSLMAIDANGSVDWSLKLDGYNGTRSLAIDAKGICYVGSDTTMYSVSADGNVRWTYRISTGHVGSPAITRNGTVVFGSTTGLFELGSVDQGNEWVVLIATLAIPLVLCAVIIFAARRLLRTKTVGKEQE
jgi:outer membrane protein assembly factor BamB